MISNAVAGLVAGTLCALGGALKDAPWEGFKPWTFLRSPLIGLAWGIVSVLVTGQWIPALVFAGYLERVTVEGYKILRQVKPGKFEQPERILNGWRVRA